MNLLWTPDKLPRTMTRKQWRKIDRWRRVTEKSLDAQRRESARQAQMIATSRPDIASRMFDRLMNPALLVHPLMTPKFDGVISPARVC